MNAGAALKTVIGVLLVFGPALGFVVVNLGMNPGAMLGV